MKDSRNVDPSVEMKALRCYMCEILTYSLRWSSTNFSDRRSSFSSLLEEKRDGFGGESDGQCEIPRGSSLHDEPTEVHGTMCFKNLLLLLLVNSALYL